MNHCPVFFVIVPYYSIFLLSLRDKEPLYLADLMRRVEWCEPAFRINIYFQPSDHGHVVARFTHATADQINEAIEVALAAREAWEHTPLK